MTSSSRTSLASSPDHSSLQHRPKESRQTPHHRHKGSSTMEAPASHPRHMDSLVSEPETLTSPNPAPEGMIYPVQAYPIQAQFGAYPTDGPESPSPPPYSVGEYSMGEHPFAALAPEMPGPASEGPQAMADQ
jgi:hypothetical protein